MRKYGLLLLMFCSISFMGANSAIAMEENSVSKESSGSAPSVMILGASYARGWAIENIVGKTVVNSGVGGSQSHEMLARMSESVLQDRPDVLIIWGFINDIFRSDKEKIESTLLDTRENFKQMVSLAKGLGVEVLLATEVTISEPVRGWKDELIAMAAKVMGKSSYQDYVNGHVRTTNDWIRQFAHEQGVVVLEFEKVLSGRDGYRKAEFSQADGSHLTQAAYDALTLYMRSAYR